MFPCGLQLWMLLSWFFVCLFFCFCFCLGFVVVVVVCLFVFHLLVVCLFVCLFLSYFVLAGFFVRGGGVFVFRGLLWVFWG